MENGDIEWLQARILGGGLDRELHRGIEEVLDGGVKAIKRDKHAGRAVLNLDGGGLEGVEQGTLAASQVHSRGSHLANGLEDFLNKLELIRDEGIGRREVLGILVGPHRHAGLTEGELIPNRVSFFRKESLEELRRRLALGQQASPENFVHIRAGERHAGLEAGRDAGKVVGPALVHFSDDGINILLRGDNNPCSAAAGRAKRLRDGLEIEHELGVLPDKGPHLIREEEQAVIGPFRVEVFLHPFAEVFHGEGEVALGIVEPLCRRFLGLAQCA